MFKMRRKPTVEAPAVLTRSSMVDKIELMDGTSVLLRSPRYNYFFDGKYVVGDVVDAMGNPIGVYRSLHPSRIVKMVAMGYDQNGNLMEDPLSRPRIEL